ncbi:hypothetical protein CEXT_287241 [Caerostris extrusa]|uniref:Secreted protein n=1 Tax=Caerostris extrusa TaxID=172846 RepID=A0AAV4MKW8_CAEEX|nr:hypothetical protein CEXT_287241 [Caerostris extrusa]
MKGKVLIRVISLLHSTSFLILSRCSLFSDKSVFFRRDEKLQRDSARIKRGTKFHSGETSNKPARINAPRLFSNPVKSTGYESRRSRFSFKRIPVMFELNITVVLSVFLPEMAC